MKQIYKSLPKGSSADAEATNAYRGPPNHFHVNQTERFKVLKGRLGIEVNGKITVLRPEDDVAICLAGNIHRFFVDVTESDLEEDERNNPGREKRRVSGQEEDEEVIALINCTDSGKDFAMDRVFLENWYGLRHDSLKYGKGIDFIQKCCVSKDSYFSPPPSIYSIGLLN